MAVLDPERDTIVIRVVYDGPPLAGKTTSVRALANGVGGRVVVPEEVAGRTLYFDWLDYTGGLFEGRRIRCQIVSVPGQATLASRRRHLLESADAVVFVGDSTLNAQPSARSYFEGLRAVLAQRGGTPVGIVLQANKRDHADAVPIETMRELLGTSDLRIAIIESVATEGSGIREAFVFAVRLALDRVRELMRLGQLAATRPQVDSAEDLLSELRRVEGGALSLAADTGLRHTLLNEVQAPTLALAAFEQTLRDDRIDDIAATTSQQALSLEDKSPPLLPSSDVPTGMIWPPVNGRLILHEIAAGAPCIVRLANGDWGARIGGRWGIHSAQGARFDSLDSGREALVNWARMHVASAQLLSDRRCIVLSQGGQGCYRLWQLIALEPSLLDQFKASLGQDPASFVESLLRVVECLMRAAEDWLQAACWLPLSLRKVGNTATGPRFLGNMPLPHQARVPERRIQSTVLDNLSGELAFALPTIRSQRGAVLAALHANRAGHGKYSDPILVFAENFLRTA